MAEEPIGEVAAGRRYVVGGVDVTAEVRANVDRFGRLEDADPNTLLRLRALFGPAIAAVRREAQQQADRSAR